MSIRIEGNHQRLLLVEGEDEIAFFNSLNDYLDIRDKFELVKYEGRNKLQSYLFSILNDSNFSHRTHIGIVRDADYNTNAFQSVITALNNANRNSKNQFPIPTQPLVPTNESPYISILILPSADAEGMLEDVVLEALQDDDISVCVDNYFECLSNAGIQISENRLPKAKVNVFISGKLVDQQETSRRDTKRMFLREIFRMSWWHDEFWEHPSFTDIRTFLHQLTTD